MKYKILNKKEKERLLKEITTQYKTKPLTDLLNYGFLKDKENKIYLISRDVNQEFLKISQRVGLYFCKLEKDGIRLSIEGSQLIKKFLTRSSRILELTKKQIELWFKGENIEVSKDLYGWFILVYNKDVIGCGKAKNGILLNFLPKERRIKELII